MRKFILGAALLVGAGLASPFATTAARAEIEYPYCGFGRQGSGGCLYSTLEQCHAFISGAGGSCYPNPRYTASAKAPARPRR